MAGSIALQFHQRRTIYFLRSATATYSWVLHGIHMCKFRQWRYQTHTQETTARRTKRAQQNGRSESIWRTYDQYLIDHLSQSRSETLATAWLIAVRCHLLLTTSCEMSGHLVKDMKPFLIEHSRVDREWDESPYDIHHRV